METVAEPRERMARTDPGEPGTARWQRMMVLKLHERQVGERCRPRLPQPVVSGFERASVRLTLARARQLAEAYFPDLYRREPGRAEAATWRIWIVGAKAYGSAAMKVWAESMQRRGFGGEIPLAPADEYPLLAQGQPERAAVAAMPAARERDGQREVRA